MKKGYCIYLDEEVIKAVDKISIKNYRSTSFIINEILKEKLKVKIK